METTPGTGRGSGAKVLAHDLFHRAVVEPDAGRTGPQRASAEHLTTFVVSGVATVLVTRLILSLSGYPQIGGKGLHIAHVLPGGLLMLVSISLLLGYVGPVVRPAAALVGGVGFGLFIDEVGKFVTSDNDYFYQPTAAIVYVVFVLIVLATRFLTTRRPIDPREQLANVIDPAVEGVAGGLSGAAGASLGATASGRTGGGRAPRDAGAAGRLSS